MGKTTSSYYVAIRLSAYGGRVLVIDGDPQGNLTSAFNLDQYGVEIDEETPVLLDVVTGGCSIQDAIIAITPNLVCFVLPQPPWGASTVTPSPASL